MTAWNRAYIFWKNKFTSRIGKAQFCGYFIKNQFFQHCEWGWMVEKVCIKDSRWCLIGNVLRYLFNVHIVWILAKATWISKHFSAFTQTTSYLPWLIAYCSRVESSSIFPNCGAPKIWWRDKEKISFGN